MLLTRFIRAIFGDTLRPLAMMGLLILIAAALLSGPRVGGQAGLSCRLTDSPEINRVLCSLTPDRLAMLLR